MDKSKLFLSISLYVAKQLLLNPGIFQLLFTDFSVQILKKVVLFCEVWVKKAEIFENYCFRKLADTLYPNIISFFRRKKL